MMSIYEYIAEQCRNGGAPADVDVSALNPPEGDVRFVDGAIDGISLYHGRPDELDEQEKGQIDEFLRLISDGAYVAADAMLEAFAAEHRALNVIDTVQRKIMEKASRINAGNLHRYAFTLIVEGDRPELIKYGMEMLELFGEPEEQIKNVIRLLGMNDEFTLFACFLANNWADANEEIFRLAKAARGWGRIHAVERLQPETGEIREWFLYEGIKNEIMPDYSAVACYRKAGVRELLRCRLTEKKYRAVSAIMAALLAEGPVKGISQLAEAREILENFLKRSEEQALCSDRQAVVEAAKEYLRK